MKNAIDKLFSNVHDIVQKNIETAKTGKAVTALAADTSGQLPFTFQLDANGYYSYSVSKYGAGKTLTCQAVILNPNATYSITITSSDGGGGQWNNVSVNEPLNFTLETSFWHSTTITVSIQATVDNQSGNGMISYSY